MLVGMVTPVVAGGHIKDILIIQSPEFHFNDTGGFVPGGAAKHPDSHSAENEEFVCTATLPKNTSSS